MNKIFRGFPEKMNGTILYDVGCKSQLQNAILRANLGICVDYSASTVARFSDIQSETIFLNYSPKDWLKLETCSVTLYT